jgi:hypothetical protein
LTDVIRQHLLRAQKRMATQANKNRIDVQLVVGDQFFLKLQPYVQLLVVIKHPFSPPTFPYFIRDIESRCLFLTSSTTFVELSF